MGRRARIAMTVTAGSLAAASALGLTGPSPAGTGSPGFAGDGGPAVTAMLSHPTGVAAHPNGGYVVADYDNDRVRRVDSTGRITTLAGGNVDPETGPADRTGLWGPRDVAVAAGGAVLIADQLNNVIRRIEPNGSLTTIAGSGASGFDGDGGPAIDASFDRPAGLAIARDGAVLVADQFNNRIRRIALDGTVSTIAGTGMFGDTGDEGLATAAELNLPTGLAVAQDGAILIADQGNHRIRRIDPSGRIATVAGTGEPGFGGDGGAASAALLDGPSGVASLAGGGFLIADHDNQRVRRVGPDGVITTIVGDGTFDTGDLPAVAGPNQLAAPADVAVGSDGAVLIADAQDNRVRVIPEPSAPLPTVAATARRPALRVTALRAAPAAHGLRVTYLVSGRSRVSLWVKPQDGSPAIRVATRLSPAGQGILTWSGRLRGRSAAGGRYLLIVTAKSGALSARSRLVARLASR